MSETIADTTTRLTQFMAESFADADVAPGSVLSELVVKPQATAQNPLRNAILDVGQANSIKKALDSESDTYETAIDYIGSNFNAIRSQGRKALGKLKVLVASAGTYPLKKGMKFTQPVLGLNFLVTQDLVAVSNPTGATEIQLVKSGSSYYFIAPVEAENAGSAYQVPNQTSFDVGSGRITGFIEAKAYGSFTAGAEVETDKQFINRFQSTLSNRTLLTKASIAARLRELYPNFRDISLVGANDAEMSRSKHNLLGISSLGVVDAYIRNTLGVETLSIEKLATKESDGVWTFSLDYNDAPGFYRIISITPKDENLLGSLAFTCDFGFSTANLTVANAVYTTEEARFTKYQTCDVTVEYTPTVATFEGYFNVTVSYQPNLGAIQDLFLSSDEQIACADYLVKAVLPCAVTVGVKLHRNSASTVLPVSKIRQDIYNYVNSIPLGDRLQASQIIDICHNYDIKYVELPITLLGEIYTNKSTTISITGQEGLTIPSKPALGVSPKTTAFIIDYFRPTDDNRMMDGISIDVL